MLATSCSCGFETLEDEQVIDHLLVTFTPADAVGTDGLIHEEIANQTCSCSFSALSTTQMDAHFLAAFTPANPIAPDGHTHQPTTIQAAPTRG